MYWTIKINMGRVIRSSVGATCLLHLGAPVLVRFLRGALAEHLLLRVDVHRDLKECLVEERHARLEAPRHRRLVGAQTVGRVQVFDPLHALDVERLGIWRRMEVQVSCNSGASERTNGAV